MYREGEDLMGDFEIKGLEEFQEKLITVQKKAPDRIIENLDKQGENLRKEIRKNTPVGTSKRKKLKNSFKLNEVEKVNGGYSKGLRSNAPHFHLIERGHRVVNKKGETVDKVDGLFFLEKTTMQMEEPIMNDMKKWLDKLFEELK